MIAQPAFSAVARDYDASFTDTKVGRLQREQVWHWLTQNITGAPAVLELNCGTGADALWMAKRGWQVLATDISPDMVQVTAEKVRQAGQQKLVTTRVCSFSEIDQLREGPFDLVFSNFGGLNCTPPQTLEALWTNLLGKLKPGGQLVVVVMSRFCAWETLYFLLKMNPKQAFRRLRRGPVVARLDQNTSVDTWYYSPSDIASGFPDTCTLSKAKPIGFWLPPSYLEPFFAKRPRLLRFLTWLEKNATASWLARASDHYLLCITKASDTHP